MSFALQAPGEVGAPSSTPQEGGQRLSPLQFPRHPPGGSVCSHQRVNGSPIILSDTFLYLYVQGFQDTVNVVDEVLQLLYGSITWKKKRRKKKRGGCCIKSVACFNLPSTRTRSSKATTGRRPWPCRVSADACGFFLPGAFKQTAL